MTKRALLLLLPAFVGCGLLDGVFQLSGDPCVLQLGEDCDELADCFGCGQLCGAEGSCDAPDLAFSACGLTTQPDNVISDDFNLFLDPQGDVDFTDGVATFVIDVVDDSFGVDVEDLFLRVSDNLIAPVDLRGPAGDGGEGFRVLASGEDADVNAVVHELEVTLRFDEGVPDALNLIVQARTDGGLASNSVCVVTNGDFDL